MFRAGRARRSRTGRIVREVAQSVNALTAAMSSFLESQTTANQNKSHVSVISKMVDQKNPPKYDGRGDPTKLENWIMEFEKIFSTMKVPEDMQVDIATYHLVDDANLWWTNNKLVLTTAVTQSDGGDEDQEEEKFGWTEFTKALRQEFFPPHMKKRKRDEFINLEQGNMSVHDFYVKFQELARFNPGLVPDEQEKANKFEEKLNPELNSKMGAGEYTSLREVYIRASNAERIEEKLVTSKKKKSGSTGFTHENDKGGNSSNHKSNGDFGKNKNFVNSHSGGNLSKGGSDQRYHKDNQNSTQFQNQPQKLERRYNCKWCKKNHPGEKCNGESVKCNFCDVLGHRAFECDSNPDATFRGPNHISKKPGGVGAQPANKFQNGGTANAARGKRDTGHAHVMNHNKGNEGTCFVTRT